MGRYVDLEYARWVGTRIVSSPYQAYVPCPLNGWAPTLPSPTRELVRLAERRVADIGLLDVAEPETLRLLLTRAEGLATSGVENIRTTMRSMSLLESLRGRRRPETDIKDRLTLGSVRMNTDAVALADRDGDVTAGDVERLHRALFADTAEHLDAGRFRREPVWVGSSHGTPLSAHYVPPPHAEVPALMGDLSEYISDRTVWVPAVAKAAVVHAQFETIHPFTDGNGRVGRALTSLVLRRDGHLRVPVPLSAAVEARRDAYYDSLQASRFVGDRSDEAGSAAITASVEFTSDALIVACDYAAATARQVDDWERKCRGLSPRATPSAAEILRVIRKNPAATLPFLVERSGLNRRTAARALSRLTDLGVLAQRHDHETGARVFEASGLLSIVDDRDRLLDEAWHMHLSGQTGIPERLHQLAGAEPGRCPGAVSQASDPDAPQPAPRAPRCGHTGTRSHKPCRRRQGHPGSHAY